MGKSFWSPSIHGSGKIAEEGKVNFYLASMYHRQGNYIKANELYVKALRITTEIGVREIEGACYQNLGALSGTLGEYVKAQEYLKEALAIKEEIGDRQGEASCYSNLGTVFRSLGEYGEAKDCYRKALVINKEKIGDKQGEATDYVKLGTVFRSAGEYIKAEEYIQKAFALRQEISDRKGEASCYGKLGELFRTRGEADKAVEYYERALAIRKEINDIQGEAEDYVKLGTVFSSINCCKYVKAEECLKKALAIRKEINDRKGEVMCYCELGNVFRSLGEYTKAEEYYQRALVIYKEIGHRIEEAFCYASLGTVFQSRGEYVKAKEYYQRALVIYKENGDRNGESSCYGNLGILFKSLDEYSKAEEYLKKSLEIKRETGDRDGEASCCNSIGNLFRSIGQYEKAKEYHEKALAVSKDIGDKLGELISYFNLACYLVWQGNMSEALKNLYESIYKCEEMRSFLRDNDQFKVSFLDDWRVFPHRFLGALLICLSEKSSDVLWAMEIGRAMALADLLSTQYTVEQQLLVNPTGTEKVMEKESKVCCLYMSYFKSDIFLWILKANRATLFRFLNVQDYSVFEGSRIDLDNFFGKANVRKFHVSPEGDCEDRSPFPLNARHPTRHVSSQEVQFRLVEEDEDEIHDPEPSLELCYKLFIAPVADLLDEPEILIVPDRSLYKVPFAALKDENEKYLTETYRIRIVPSLMTLKLMQDSPIDYHSQTGALIVGDPQVAYVYYKGRLDFKSSLPFARKEAEMIGQMLGAQPLLGKQATKQVVLQRIHSVSLIHFAAHGNAERGEIALSPQSHIHRIPQEEDYLLTMQDVSKVRLRAKLVVLSYCHSASGQVRAEGVVGIARAFLGSAARSVLVALWALEDKATEQFMSCFYEHLVLGESASESLHQSMKWMRGNGFPDVKDWAPFMLIGDDVTFNFGK